MPQFLNFSLSFTAALILHELGHLVAARLFSVRVKAIGFGWGPTVFRYNITNTECQLRLFPVGAFVRLDMENFRQRRVNQQLIILGAGIFVNLVLAFLMWGSLFGLLNLGLAVGNLLPFYQQDGWKGAIVISREMLGKKSPIVEWILTIVGGLVALAVLAKAVLVLSVQA
jgi:regulator of sigma E protease